MPAPRVFSTLLTFLLALLAFAVEGESQDFNRMTGSKKVEFLEKQWEVARQSGDQKRQLEVLKELTREAFFARDFRKAAEAGEAQLSILEQLNNQKEEVEVLQFLASAHKEQKEYQQEIATCEKWLKVAQAMGNNGQASSALTTMGIAYRNLGNYPQSTKALQQALDLAAGAPREAWNAAITLSLTYEQAGDLPKAAQYGERALAIARESAEFKNSHMGEADSLYRVGLIYFEQGKYQQAIDAIEQSIPLLSQEDMSKMASAERREDLGFILFRSGNLAKAEQAVLAAINDYDTARNARSAIFKNLKIKSDERESVEEYEFGVDSPRLLEQILVAQKRTDEALEWAEKGRARAFLAELGSRAQSPPPSPTIEQLKQTAKTQRSTLVEYSVVYDALTHHRVRFGWEEPAPTALFVWVVKPTGEITFRSVDLTPVFGSKKISLGEFVRNARASIGARGRGGGRTEGEPSTESLRQLHETLIQPIADLLPNDPEALVTFIPQDALFLVPFSALKDRSGDYLIEKHTISTAPSIQVLDLTHQLHQPGKASGALVVGNPKMPSYAEELGDEPQPLRPLEGTEAEAKAVAALLDTQPLIGAQATRAAVVQRLPNVRTIHLATHGLLDDSSGLRSAIALAPSGEDNGFLTAEDILDLKLNAELTVLSACDTGGGRITGDGVVGLSRSFISAGVPSLIVSLWSVQDAPTASLMTSFYQALKKNPDKAQALRQAMLTTKSKYPLPEDWGAFVLVGEAQ